MTKKCILGIFSVLSIFFLTDLVFAKKLAILNEVLIPSHMTIEGNHIYIREKKTVSIYSLDSFKLLKKIGGKGEGPGEFRSTPSLRIYPEYLSMEDLFSNRISFFSRDGNFKFDMKIPEDIYYICKVGDNFIATKSDMDFETMVTKKNIILYSKDFKQIKKLSDWEGVENIVMGKGSTKKFDLDVFRDCINYCVHDDLIYLADTRKGFFLSVFDSVGNKLYDIDKEYEEKKVTEKIKNKRKKDSKRTGFSKNFNLIFRKCYPAFEKFEVRTGKIYVWTYERKDKKHELIALDLKGNILKRALLNWHSLYSLNDSNYYYLFENEDENCELHVEIIN